MLNLQSRIGLICHLQIVKKDKYTALSDKNRITHRLIEPQRGLIYDLSGKLIAINKENYQAAIIFEEIVNIREALEAFNHILPSANLNISQILKEINQSKKFVSIKIADDLSWKEFAKLNANIHRLNGVYPLVGFKRYYPMGESHSHLLGYTSSISEDESYSNPLSKLNNGKSGKIGIEKSEDEKLRGELGNRNIEVNANGREIRELGRVDSKKGKNIQLTIDSDVQKYCFEQLKDVSGSIAITNVNTGEYIALVSSPGFDPNLFNRGLSNDLWQSLLRNKFKPLINKSISNLYPPGSTIKPLVALAALESGVDSKMKLFCNGKHDIVDTSLESGFKTFHCWKKNGHGEVDLSKAIKVSCDVYFYQIARKIGINKISETCKRFGLGKEVFNVFYEEKKGLVPNKEWKKKELGKSWMVGETLSAGIGQGYFLTNAAQLSLALAQIVNGGNKLKPSISYNNDEKFNSNEYSTSIIANKVHLKIIKNALYQATNEVGGTSYRSRVVGNLKMAGKTGTSQVRAISAKERKEGIIKNKNLPWEKRDHGLFIGYGPTDKPIYSISVIIEHGGSGSGAAAPIASKVFQYLFNNKMNLKHKSILNV